MIIKLQSIDSESIGKGKATGEKNGSTWKGELE